MCVYVCRAWEQMEVTCARNTRRANVLWNVEQLTDSRCKSSDVFLTQSRSPQSDATALASSALTMTTNVLASLLAPQRLKNDSSSRLF